MTEAEVLVVTEHWTDSRRAVVLSGTPPTLEALARLLDLPPSQVVIMRITRASLGLWEEEHLDAYEQLKRSGRVVVCSA